MEEKIKNLIKSMVYYGLAVKNESMELIIRKFYYNKGKKWCDDLMKAIPESHPAKKYYNKVNNDNFDEIQLMCFTKMSMWQIKERVDSWDFLHSEETVDKFVETINEMDINTVDTVKKFIQENENMLTETPNKYEFYFAMLYRYITSKEEYSKSTEFLKEQVDLIEKCKFEPLFEDTDEIGEKYRYLLKLYDDLTWELCENKQYDIAEIYYKRYIRFLEEYLKEHDLFQAKSYLSTAYSDYGYILWDIMDGINDKSDELTYKAIELRKKLAEENGDKKSYFYNRIAVNYNNMAYEYKKAYKKEKKQEYKEKYYELYRKAIFYREELNKLGEFKNVDTKIKNYSELGKMYYFIYEDEKARENWEIALKICKDEGSSDEKWIETITNNLKSKEENDMSSFEKSENIIDKKISPKYYLNLEAKQKESFLEDKSINRFVDDATKDIDINYRLSMYIILKFIILKNGYDKQEIIRILSEMYKKEELEKIINSSPLNKQSLQKFVNINESDRKIIIEEFIIHLKNLEFDICSNKIGTNLDIDEDIANTIEKEEYTYIEYYCNEYNKRILYLYRNGLVIAINIKNKQCTSIIKQFKKQKMIFIEEFLELEKYQKNTNDEMIYLITYNNKVMQKNKCVFYIILALLSENKKLQNKIFFDYEYYFACTFKNEVRMLNSKERADLFLFTEWCPEELEYKKISEECDKIASKINIEVADTDITELYYFANYYKHKKEYTKAIEFYERLAKNGIDYANGEIAYIYNLEKNLKNEKEYLSKVNDIIDIYKELTAKKCYKITIDDSKKIPDIKDSKMYGKPYIPVGEQYPKNKDGKPLTMIIQINLKDIKLDSYPKTGILQVFVDTDSTSPETKLRYYEDTSLPYQTEISEINDIKFWEFAPCNVKINLEEHITYMPLIDKRIESILKKVIKEYNKIIGINLFKYEDVLEVLWYLIESKVENYPLLVGGYADYANTDYYTSKNKESLLKLMSDLGHESDNFSMNVLISKKNLEDRNFNKAEIVFEY